MAMVKLYPATVLQSRANGAFSVFFFKIELSKLHERVNEYD